MDDFPKFDRLELSNGRVLIYMEADSDPIWADDLDPTTKFGRFMMGVQQSIARKIAESN